MKAYFAIPVEHIKTSSNVKQKIKPSIQGNLVRPHS